MPALPLCQGGTLPAGALHHLPHGVGDARKVRAVHDLLDGSLFRNAQGLPQSAGVRAGVPAAALSGAAGLLSSLICRVFTSPDTTRPCGRVVYFADWLPGPPAGFDL